MTDRSHTRTVTRAAGRTCALRAWRAVRAASAVLLLQTALLLGFLGAPAAAAEPVKADITVNMSAGTNSGSVMITSMPRSPQERQPFSLKICSNAACTTSVVIFVPGLADRVTAFPEILLAVAFAVCCNNGARLSGTVSFSSADQVF